VKLLFKTQTITLFIFQMILTVNAQERYFPQFRLESGLFGSSKDVDRNPSTGDSMMYSYLEGGMELGVNCRIARNHFVSIWGNLGFFGESQVLISQSKFGITFLYGDLTSSFAVGPCFALGGDLGQMIGVQLCYKNFYIKGLTGRMGCEFNDLLLYRYSFSAGYTFAIWPKANTSNR
jgi:hypothetical protein